MLKVHWFCFWTGIKKLRMFHNFQEAMNVVTISLITKLSTIIPTGKMEFHLIHFRHKIRLSKLNWNVILIFNLFKVLST